MTLTTNPTEYTSVTHLKSNFNNDLIKKKSDGDENNFSLYSNTEAVKSTQSNATFSASSLHSSSHATLLKEQEAQQDTANAPLKEIAGEYDVTNLSGYERVAMSQDLRDASLIQNDVMMTMIAPLSIGENMNDKTDFLSTIENAVEFLTNSGNLEQAEIHKKALDILERLNSLHNDSEMS